jgi:hypothetical protein
MAGQMGDMMSHRRTIALALIGAAAGAWAGVGYLDDNGRCTASLIEGHGACRLNHAWVPFLGTVFIGILAAFAIASIVGRISRRTPPPAAAPSGLPAPDGEQHDLEAELQEMTLSASELGLERSEPRPARIGERGRPVPRPRRGLNA